MQILPELAFAQDLIAHWDEIRGTDLVPLRQKLDPARFAKLLPQLWIGEFVAPDKLYFRLVGEEIRSRVEDNPAGANSFDVVPEADRPRAILSAQAVLNRPCGLYYTYEILLDGQVVDLLAAVVLPLRGAGDAAPRFTVTAAQRIGGRGITQYDNRGARVVRAKDTRFFDIGAGLPDT